MATNSGDSRYWIAATCGLCLFLSGPAAVGQTSQTPLLELSFRRGDASANGQVDISDATRTFGWLLLGSETPPCLDAVDSNDDGRTDIADGIYTLNALFRGGPGVPSPGTETCGRDLTRDDLGCANYAPCMCGGIAGFECDDPEHFCDLSPGFCGGAADLSGTCVPVPEVCPEIFDPVCGCDGVTYANDCERIRAGVQKDHHRSCGEPLGFRTLERDVTSGAPPQTAIFRDQGSWEAFWSDHGSIFTPTPDLPVVDFETEMVVAVVTFFTSGGYHVKIDEVLSDAGSVVVQFTQVEPSDDCGTTDAETQPYHLVAVSRTAGDLVQVVNRLSACCAQGMDAAGVGDCERIFGYAWDGNACQEIVGCECAGDDCSALFGSPGECEAAFNGCPTR